MTYDYKPPMFGPSFVSDRPGQLHRSARGVDAMKRVGDVLDVLRRHGKLEDA